MFGILKYLRDKARNRALKSKKRVSSGTFVNLQNVKTIGFLYNITSSEYKQELEEIIRILDRTGILYKGLAVESVNNLLPQSENVDTLPDEVQWLNNNSITLIENIYVTKIGTTECDKKDLFLKEEFDLFISFDNADSFTMEYIVRDIKAKCIVGMHSYKNSAYTIVFEGENKSTLSYSEYLVQIFHYLSVIKSGKI